MFHFEDEEIITNRRSLERQAGLKPKPFESKHHFLLILALATAFVGGYCTDAYYRDSVAKEGKILDKSELSKKEIKQLNIKAAK